MTRIGVYPGTFDPITVGHLDIIRRAMHVVDKLIIGVALDTGKAPIFDLEARSRLVISSIALEMNGEAERIEVQPFSGLLVNFARQNHACLLVRGLRAVSDFEYEFQMACMNSRLAPEIETIFLTASDSKHYVSSRFVKQIARLGGDVSAFVTPNVAQSLADFYSSHKE
jgi:pantetheine-phosphate adenylyltransferase